MRKSRVLFLILLTVVFLSCSEEEAPKITLPAPTGGTGSTAPTGTTPDTAPATVTIALNVTTVTFGGTVSVKATVKDKGGKPVADGTTVKFTVTGDTSLGSVTGQATTNKGEATATFTAGTTKPGTVKITAQADTITKISDPIAIVAPKTGSIEFVSASPQAIGLKGSGQAEVSLVTFVVKDVNGNPVVDGIGVDFAMSGPSGGKTPSNGGEYIGDVAATTSAATTTAKGATKSSGKATIFLNSGAVAGAVTIVASVTIDGITFSSSSPTISIGGGVASAPHFSLAASPLNIPGLAFSGIKSKITAFVADRFGNFNVLKGTSVSFYTEAGAIDRSNVTDSTGVTTVDLRSQAPAPLVVIPNAPPTLNPINGWVTVLGTVLGEEGFDDKNGNGQFDAGEGFADLSEPFLDKNNNGVRDAEAGEKFEFFVDTNGNGQFDPPNGLWDGPGCQLAQPASACQNSKVIWDDMRLAFTGGIGTCRIAPVSPTTVPFAVLNQGAPAVFNFTLGDVNNNILPAGTTIKVTTTKGTLNGTTSFTLADDVGGPLTIGFSLSDPDTDDTLDASTIIVDVVPGVVQGASVGGCSTAVSGTVR